ncbi:DUF3617 domain-containing protein [Hansschlegelia zhihuaiae]|uniref:DUF3617 family protein n=1 Tax=Hansschlegelia zhihuaiae TaxID=405005 RepID=A0A4Q0MJ65_9HYPH|nr:DUF3617 family protein [Hansschlegelia zhihuaiae]RXF73741.1 DUF3617 family protein [Hansschlegelia zhihuaiae]
MRLWFCALAALAAAAPVVALAEDGALRDGAYEVAYRLELPHLESRGEEVRTLCLRDVGGAAALPALSPNNPLAGCPARNVRRVEGGFAFDIVCPGGGAARASAEFSTSEESFQGVIAMTMGGKNMTMSEVQRGRRVGDCAAAADMR